MAIDPNTLQIRITDTQAMLDVGRSYLVLSYEIFHEPTGAVVASNQTSQLIGAGVGFLEADATIRRWLDTYLRIIRWHHTGLDTLDGLSPHDAGLCLENWQFARDGEYWSLTHPLSGTFSLDIVTDETFPPLTQRVLAVMAAVLPPPMWTWASSPEAGKLEAHCVTVPEATSYNVYDDHGDGTFTLLASPPTANGGTLTIAPGEYTVRVAGVVAGVVGVLGQPVRVTVADGGGGEAMASADLETLGEFIPAEVEAVAETPTFGARVRKFFTDPFGVLPDEH